jgi:hypothetical protein
MNSCLLLDDIDCEYEEIEDNESQEQNNNEISLFINEVKPIILKCIKNYFLDKVMHDDQEIKDSLLELPYYTDLLFNTSMADGVLKGYKLIEDNNFIGLDCIEDQNSISEDIRYMINLIRNIQKYIPQEFVGGMILMHLELVEGMEIW